MTVRVPVGGRVLVDLLKASIIHRNVDLIMHHGPSPEITLTTREGRGERGGRRGEREERRRN